MTDEIPPSPQPKPPEADPPLYLALVGHPSLSELLDRLGRFNKLGCALDLLIVVRCCAGHGTSLDIAPWPNISLVLF